MPAAFFLLHSLAGLYVGAFGFLAVGVGLVLLCHFVPYLFLMGLFFFLAFLAFFLNGTNPFFLVAFLARSDLVCDGIVTP